LRVIAVANQKGGCGKTTTCINFAACLAHLGKKVLLIDMDPQGHSTCGLGISCEELPYTLYDLLRAGNEYYPRADEVRVEINPCFSLLPATTSLALLEEELTYLFDREKRLRHQVLDALFTENAFDYTILDCPPNLGVLTENALFNADEVMVPVEPSFFALHGLAKISETIERVNARRKEPLVVHALLTIFNSKMCFSQEIYDEVKAHFRDQMFRSIIHESITLKEAAGAGKSIVDYAPDTQACRDHLNLATEYLDREWKRIFHDSELSGWREILQHRYGPRRVIGGILFQCRGMGARSVEIAGDFNNWVPEPLVRRQDHDDLWQKIIPVIACGQAFRYKYIIDGEWQIDAAHSHKVRNAYGSYDSYLELV